MIIITGGAGFIGSALVWKLNEQGCDDLMIVDQMGHGQKWKNLAKRRFRTLMHKDQLLPWLEDQGSRVEIEAVVHLGASSSTTETNVDYLVQNNLNYSVHLWNYCRRFEIPYIYASSAATYGDGEHGYDDDAQLTDKLKALNPYGFSKQKFDAWVLGQQDHAPPFWAGLRFFNVYGPQEYHKAGQSSVVYQFVPQIKQSGTIKLFKSYRSDVGHGEQRRDFVYVKDVANIMMHFLSGPLNGTKSHAASGIYNIGTGKARSFADLARATFRAMGIRPEKLDWIEMPEQLRDQYQYFTEAKLSHLRERGHYQAPFTSIEDGVEDYLRRYLLTQDPYL